MIKGGCRLKKRYLLPRKTRGDIALLRALAGYDCTDEDIIAYAVQLLKERCSLGIIRMKHRDFRKIKEALLRMQEDMTDGQG